MSQESGRLDDRDVIISNLERKLHASQQVVEQLTRELEAFSYSVSHDLRSPLRSILGFSAALEEDFGPILVGEGHDYIARIRAGGQKMDELISAILSVSRISRSQIRKEQLDVSELALSFTRDLKRAFPQTTYTVAAGLSLYGDLTLTKVALSNLLDNASIYSKPKSIPEVFVGVKSVESAEVIFVQDNGIGFSEADALRIFEPFERTEQPSVTHGVGVGLTNARRAIERQGGRIWAESILDEGSTFYISLPNEDFGIDS